MNLAGPLRAFLATSFLLTATLSLADDPGTAGLSNTAVVPADTKLAVRIHLPRIAKSVTGGRLLKGIEAVVQAESGVDQPLRPQMTEILGMDPFDEVRAIDISTSQLASSDGEMPNGLAVVHLGRTAGNLEGLWTMLPQYRFQSYGKQTIHQAEFEGQPVFATVLTGSSGQKNFVASNQSSSVQSFVGGNDLAGQTVNVEYSDQPGLLIQSKLLSIPQQWSDQPGPMAGLQLVKDAKLQIKEVASDLAINVSLRADDPDRAEQLRQMVQGLKAMMPIALEKARGEGEGAELEETFELVQRTRVTRDGPTVVLELSVPIETVLQFFRDEAKLPL